MTDGRYLDGEVEINLTLKNRIDIWGIALPADALRPEELIYLNQIASIKIPSVEWLWHEMDRVWESFGLDNRRDFGVQAIGDFYSHPVWLVNGVFSAVDPTSVRHRNSIAKFIEGLSVNRVADYGGGFGELALRIKAADSKVHVDIVEPYPSAVGMSRVGGEAGIRFVKELDGEYDCIIAQDVLEHVEHPLALAVSLVQATKLGGHLVFANCFYPVIKCHLPSTFYLRHTFSWVVGNLGLNFEGNVDGALVFKKVGRASKFNFMLSASIAKFMGSTLNAVMPLWKKVLFKARRLWI